MLASPTARLPTYFGNLLASPDFACTFAPGPTATPAQPAGVQLGLQGPATAAGAPPAGLDGLGSPTTGLPSSSTALLGFPPLSTAFPPIPVSAMPAPGGSSSGGSMAPGSAPLPAFQLPLSWAMVPPPGQPAAPGEGAAFAGGNADGALGSNVLHACCCGRIPAQLLLNRVRSPSAPLPNHVDAAAEAASNRKPAPSKPTASKAGRKKSGRSGRGCRGGGRKATKTAGASAAAAASADQAG